MNTYRKNAIIQKQSHFKQPPSGCPLIYPRHGKKHSDLIKSCALKADTHTYFTISDGQKRVYTDDDGLKEYGKMKILDPDEVSYFNLFVNGVLQPHAVYEVKKGKLLFKSSELPIKGAPIILQFVTIRFR